MSVPSALGAGRGHNREHALNLKGYLLCSFCYDKYAITISSPMFRQLNQTRVTDFVHAGQASVSSSLLPYQTGLNYGHIR